MRLDILATIIGLVNTFLVVHAYADAGLVFVRALASLGALVTYAGLIVVAAVVDIGSRSTLINDPRVQQAARALVKSNRRILDSFNNHLNSRWLRTIPSATKSTLHSLTTALLANKTTTLLAILAATAYLCILATVRTLRLDLERHKEHEKAYQTSHQAQHIFRDEQFFQVRHQLAARLEAIDRVIRWERAAKGAESARMLAGLERRVVDRAFLGQDEQTHGEGWVRAEEAREKECRICTAAFDIGESVLRIPCRCDNWYHHGCIKRWLEQQPYCPYCFTGTRLAK